MKLSFLLAGRDAWLRERWVRRQVGEAARFRNSLIKGYGDVKGAAVKFAEAFEICEYGCQPQREEIKVLFAFFPWLPISHSTTHVH